MCPGAGAGTQPGCPGPVPPPWEATWPWGQTCVTLGWMGQLWQDPQPSLSPLCCPASWSSPPSHPMSGQGREPPPNCRGHGSGRSWCACVCRDPGDSGSPCFGAKPCAALGVRVEQEPPSCLGRPGAGSTGKALLGQRGHVIPWNRAGTRAAFSRILSAHKNPARLRPLLIRASPGPWGMGKAGAPVVLCWGLVAGLWGHWSAISRLSCAKLPCHPLPTSHSSTGTVPISIGHHPARPEQRMSQLSARAELQVTGAPRGAPVPRHPGMSSMSSSCCSGLPYPSRLGSMGPIPSGCPPCATLSSPKGLSPCCPRGRARLGQAQRAGLAARHQLPLLALFLGSFCAGEKPEWVEIPSWAGLWPPQGSEVGAGMWGLHSISSSPATAPVHMAKGCCPPPISVPPICPLFWGMSPPALPAQAKEMPRSSPGRAPGARPQGPGWGGCPPARHPGELGKGRSLMGGEEK